MNEKKVLDKLYSKFDKDYLEIVSIILDNSEFKRRLDYVHHENRSVFVHSLIVSHKSYKIARFLHLDYKSTAIGGLLHDFYYEDWQKNTIRKKFFKSHGFAHAKEALENSKKHFPDLINKKVSNIIVRHMFPLNIIPPRYFESWIITFVDKYVSFEIFKTPSQLGKYIALGNKKKKVNK